MQCVKSKSVTDLADATADPALERVVTLDPPPVVLDPPALEGAIGGVEVQPEEGAVGGAPPPANIQSPEVYPEVNKH